MNKKTKEKDLHDSFYEGPQLKKIAWIFLTSIFLLIGFIRNFPITTIIENKILTAINHNVSCPLSFPTPEVSLFPIPKVSFTKIIIPRPCTGLSQDLLLTDFSVKFWGLSLYPIGPKTKIQTSFHDNDVEAKIIFSLKQIILIIDEVDFNIKNISSIVENLPKITGSIKVTTHLKLNYNNSLEYIDLKINSHNINIPPQNISSFDLPGIPLNLISIGVEQETKNSILIKDFKLGDSNNSPINADFQGKIQMNNEDLLLSLLDLKGSLRLSDELMTTIPLLKLILKKYPKVGDSYQMNIGGSLTMPLPSPSN